MEPQSIACPSCGATHTIYNPGVITVVCEYCGNAVYWDAEKIKDAGKQAILPEGFEGSVRLDFLGPDGSLLQSFDSDNAPQQPKARVYFADTWLGDPQPLPATPGHHRVSWDLHLPPPQALYHYYSIAAVPERETPVLPQGPLILPGDYSVRLVAGETTVEQPLKVVMDPRVNVTQEQLADLFAFQQQVTEVLERAVTLARDAQGGDSAYNWWAGGVDPDSPAAVASALTSLAIDLGHSDAPPTAAQRELFRKKAALLDAN